MTHYLKTQRPGTLHAVIEADDESVAGDVDCTYGMTPMGDYIIRWYSEAVEDVLTNGKTYLVAEGKYVYFHSVREAFFGDMKAFVICTPSRVEEARAHLS